MTIRLRSVWIALCGIALVALSACAPVRHIRQAQDAFNDGAMLERQPSVTGPAVELSAMPAAESYKVALGLLQRELRDNRHDLAEDDLLGTALMLKALCVWRLEDLGEFPLEGDELERALAEVRTFGVERLGTRDRVLCAALPGLQDHDRGLRRSNYDEAKSYFQSAFEKLDASLTGNEVPEAHPIRGYIRLAQLSTCRAWQAAATQIDDSTRSDCEVTKVRALFESTLNDLRPLWRKWPELRGEVSRLCAEMGWTFPAK